MSLVLQSSGGGSVTLQEPVTASNLTITVPAETGTMITTASTFAGTGPAFSAYATANQTPAANTYTKVQFNTETFDTNSCYDTSTYRFTPTVAGYYQVNAMISWAGSASPTYLLLDIYKNGSAILEGAVSNNATAGPTISISNIVQLNGSTDYIEIFILNGNGTNATATGGVKSSVFSACLSRAS